MRFIKSVIIMVLQALKFNPRLKALVSLKLFSWDWQSQQDAVWLPDIRSKKYWVWHLPLLEFKDCFSDPSLELNVREDQFHRHFEERWTFETPPKTAAKLIYSSFLESPDDICETSFHEQNGKVSRKFWNTHGPGFFKGNLIIYAFNESSAGLLKLEISQTSRC